MTELFKTDKAKAAQKYEDSGSHHKIWLDRCTPTTPQPLSSTLNFRQFESLKDAIQCTKFENNDDETAQ